MIYPKLKTAAAKELIVRLGGPNKKVQMKAIDVAMSQDAIDSLKAEVKRLEGELNDIERVNHEVFAELQICRAKIDGHQRFEKRLRDYLAGGNDCYPYLKAMLDDEPPKKIAP